MTCKKRHLTYWRFIAALGAIGIGPNANADGAIIYQRSSGWFSSNSTIQVPTPSGSDAPSVYISDNGTFSSGAAAKNLAQAMSRLAAIQELAQATQANAGKAKATITPPERPSMLAFRASNGVLTGGATELLQGSGIYLMSRHVLQDRDFNDIRKSFLDSGLDPDKYRAYEFRDQQGTGERIDAILLVPKGKEGQVMEFATPREPCGGAMEPTFQLRALPQLQSKIELNDRFFSYQYGTTGHEATEQVSQGTITRLAEDRFYLDGGEQNHTSGRSSGSVVYTSSDRDSKWKIGGIVECVIPPVKNARGAMSPGGVRVISSAALGSADISPVPLEAIAQEKVPSRPDCIPVDDGRAAGGK